jgi:hypothetical protein
MFGGIAVNHEHELAPLSTRPQRPVSVNSLYDESTMTVQAGSAAANPASCAMGYFAAERMYTCTPWYVVLVMRVGDYPDYLLVSDYS